MIEIIEPKDIHMGKPQKPTSYGILPTEGKNDIIKSKHKMGWLPDLPDFRDYKFSVHRPPIVKLPTSIDLRPMCSKVEDQLQLGSCSAQALVGNLELLEIKDNIHIQDLSRLFVYYQTRVLEHTVNYDSGTTIRDGIKALAKWGVCSEALWPYIISKFADKPNLNCYTDAKNHKILLYYRLDTLDDMLTCLADGYPLVFGFAVYESFESEEVANTGIVPMPTPNEQMLGGHAVLLVGCDIDRKIFPNSIGSGLVRNSWGESWGGPMKGYFWIPMEYLINRDLSDDYWTIRVAKGL